GKAKIGGVDVILAVLDFSFLGGSMGVVVGEKLVRAADRAGRARSPLVTVVASGGARMQEGLLSLMQMAKTAAAVKRLHDRGVPYISVLTNPTTGGVFASFANLGDITLAEPGALIGFAGPRVAEQAIGRKLPPGTHTAEYLLDHGMIDAIVPRTALRGVLASLLGLLSGPSGPFPGEPPGGASGSGPPAAAWDLVQGARSLDRPTSLDYLDRMIDEFFELRGDRVSGDDPAVIAGIGMLAGNPVAVVALERGHDAEREARHGGMARPEGYRKAQRVMRLAARLGLPLLALVDTPGAYPGPESEEGGLAGELAACMALLSDLPTPTVAADIGEGGSGGALALAVA
ncbi:MAG: carboxyl transferase domain-containing protein, partial [Chloroflexota bacterium]